MKRLLLSLCLVAATGTASAQDAFLNEFHYDNDGADVGEFIEVALLSSLSPADYGIVLYNGNGGAPYNSTPLSGCPDGEINNGYTLYVCDIAGIQNGSPDGIALANTTTNTLIQFISYEGSFTAVGGIADGEASLDIGVSEPGNTPVGLSLSFDGTQWDQPATATPGIRNAGQTQLPVELVAFEAVASGDAARLTWATASETNNTGFDVQQRSGTTWTTLGFVAGKGTTLEAQRYTFETNRLAPGTYTFRLRQVDFDGAFDFSPEVELTVGVDGQVALSAASPNPFTSSTSFSVSVARSQRVTVELYNLLGQRVATLLDEQVAAGAPRMLTLDAGTLPAGLYVYRVQGETFAASRQVTLLR